MADEQKNKEEQGTSETKSNTNKSKKANKQLTEKSKAAKPPAKKGSGMGLLAIILVLALAAAGYYFYLQLQQQISSLSTSLNENQQASSNSASVHEEQTQTLSTDLENLSSKVTNVEKSASDNISILKKQVGKSQSQWLIAEAEYLVSIANTRLQLVGDTKTAIVAFQAADQRLKENGDPLTFPIRKQIAKEIIALQGTEHADIVGISSKLLALEEAVSIMEITAPHAGKVQAPELGKGSPSAIPKNIQDTLDDAWANFSKLIVIRRNNDPKAALMTPEQVELIRKNLALKLESARLALVNGDQAIYTSSLTVVADWLDDYFDAKNAAVNNAISQINSLIKTPIHTTIPDVSASLKMLRDLPLLSQQESQPAPVPEAPATPVAESSAENNAKATSSDTSSDEEQAVDKIETIKKQVDKITEPIIEESNTDNTTPPVAKDSPQNQ